MLHPEKKYCINHPSRPIFSHQRCIYCYRKEILLPKQLSKQKKVYKIKNYSPKRILLNKEYDRKKKEKWNQLILEKKNRCFFTDTWLDPNGPVPDFHHTIGRTGDLLCDMNYAFPCLFKPHRQYTDLQYTYDQLEKIDWYKPFLNRLKETYPLLYQKELYRIEKANKKVIRL